MPGIFYVQNSCCWINERLLKKKSSGEVICRDRICNWDLKRSIVEGLRMQGLTLPNRIRTAFLSNMCTVFKRYSLESIPGIENSICKKLWVLYWVRFYYWVLIEYSRNEKTGNFIWDFTVKGKCISISGYCV